jgi:hypothetical protein
MTPAETEAALETITRNQGHYFESVGHDALLSIIKAKYGPHYVDRICEAIKRAGRKSILFELVGVQPLTAPIGLIYYKKLPQEETYDDSPFICQEVCAKNRKLRAQLSLEGSSLLDSIIRKIFYSDETEQELNICFNDAWSELERDVLSTINCSKPASVSVSRSAQGILNLVNSAADCKQSGPVDAVLMSTETFDGLLPVLAAESLELVSSASDRSGRPVKAAILNSSISIYTDAYYANNELLAFRRAHDCFDRTVIWSPYMLGAAGVTIDKQCHLWLRHRGKTTLLATDFIVRGTII